MARVEVVKKTRRKKAGYGVRSWVWGGGFVETWPTIRYDTHVLLVDGVIWCDGKKSKLERLAAIIDFSGDYFQSLISEGGV